MRPFKRPKVNSKASSLYDLNITPLETLKTEPPLTRGLSDEELDKIISTPWAVEPPLSTTAVERAVKQVTAAASKSSDTFEQDGASFMAEAARKRNKYEDRNKVAWKV